jgi:hypothetical protein
MTTILPNPNLFVSMYVRHEAVLSSQIEGTQSTHESVGIGGDATAENSRSSCLDKASKSFKLQEE